MKRVRMGELRANLRELILAVQGGAEIVVLNRDTPVARIIPMPEDQPLVIREAAGRPGDVKLPRLAKQNSRISAVGLLLADRNKDRNRGR
jgi:antitoxin (DNA-binding transcriptional repressor) of toxin-antitoxin stability system